MAVAAFALAAVPAFGQAKGGPATGTTGAGSVGGGSTGGIGTAPGSIPGRTPTITTPTNPTNPQNPQNPNAGIPQPIFVSGRVAMEDGGALPEPAVIQTACYGMTHSEGYTDSKGNFALELGANRNVVPDASEYDPSATAPPGMYGGAGAGQLGMGSGMGLGSMGSGSRMGNGMGGAQRYMGCELQAKLAGYRSQTVALTGRQPMDDPNVGTILLHRLGGKEEGQTVSMVSLAAPKDAKKAYEKGMDALRKRKFADAQKNFEKAVEAYPDYAAVWYQLGQLRAAANQADIARASFQKAIQADPKFVPPYISMSLLDVQAKRWQDVADVTDKAVRLDPFDYPQAYLFNSVANYNLRNLPAAEKSALQAERLDTRKQFPTVQHLLGLILADRKDWEGAAQHFKDYLKMAPAASDAETVRSQLAQVEKIQQQLASTRDK
ncbi:MAG: tetratricopeptide repeat protein [Acidobacteria bacterium]|nr:tetratricopeptide repeat protein [Acidobacteriota bacterium]